MDTKREMRNEIKGCETGCTMDLCGDVEVEGNAVWANKLSTDVDSNLQ